MATTGKAYVAPVRPPICDPRILGGTLNQATIRVATAVNDTAKVDFAVVEGFRTGFSKNFRRAFDAKYYGQLWEETLKCKRILPGTFITYLVPRHVTLDTVVIGQLKAKYFRGWEGEERINSFGI